MLNGGESVSAMSCIVQVPSHLAAPTSCFHPTLLSAKTIATMVLRFLSSKLKIVMKMSCSLLRFVGSFAVADNE